MCCSHTWVNQRRGTMFPVGVRLLEFARFAYNKHTESSFHFHQRWAGGSWFTPQKQHQLLTSPMEIEVPDAPGWEMAHLCLLMENEFLLLFCTAVYRQSACWVEMMKTSFSMTSFCFCIRIHPSTFPHVYCLHGSVLRPVGCLNN